MNLPRKRATPRRTVHPVQPADAPPPPKVRPKRSPEANARRVDKTERRRDERMAFRDAVIAATPRGYGDCHGTPGCAHLGPHRGDDAHHVAQRSTHGTDDPAVGVYLCRIGHDWAHDHIAEATRLGLIQRSRN